MKKTVYSSNHIGIGNIEYGEYANGEKCLNIADAEDYCSLWYSTTMDKQSADELETLSEFIQDMEELLPVMKKLLVELKAKLSEEEQQ